MLDKCLLVTLIAMSVVIVLNLLMHDDADSNECNLKTKRMMTDTMMLT